MNHVKRIMVGMLSFMLLVLMIMIVLGPWILSVRCNDDNWLWGYLLLAVPIFYIMGR